MIEGEGKIALDVKNAIQEALRAGVINRIQEGDKVYLYSAINGMRQKVTKGVPQFYKSKAKNGQPMMVPNDTLKFPELFDNDFDTEHYLERIKDTAEILAGVIKNE